MKTSEASRYSPSVNCVTLRAYSNYFSSLLRALSGAVSGATSLALFWLVSTLRSFFLFSRANKNLISFQLLGKNSYANFPRNGFFGLIDFAIAPNSISLDSRGALSGVRQSQKARE